MTPPDHVSTEKNIYDEQDLDAPVIQTVNVTS